jgi:hypothetical protein
MWRFGWVTDKHEACPDEPCPANALVYFFDGGALQLPIAKRTSQQGYKKPHWFPVVFNTRQTKKSPR